MSPKGKKWRYCRLKICRGYNLCRSKSSLANEIGSMKAGNKKQGHHDPVFVGIPERLVVAVNVSERLIYFDQRSASVLSDCLASTHFQPAGVSSFFQSGTVIFRVSMMKEAA